MLFRASCLPGWASSARRRLGCKLLKDADGGGAYAPPLFAYTEEETRGERHAVHARIQCAIRGLLTINGQFCGPVDGDGQTFPTARDAEIFIEYMPLTENAKPMALELALEQGKVGRIEPRAARLRAHLAGRTDSA